MKAQGPMAPMSSLPDLAGFDASGYPGYSNNYFHILESSVSWGDQVHLNFNIANYDASSSQTFSVAFYLSQDSTITTADVKINPTYTGFSVPPSGQVSLYTNAWLILPGSNPFGAGGPYYLGMIVDSDNVVAESNESNNSNLGSGKDLCSVSISPPVAVVADSVGSSTDHAVEFGSVVNDGIGNTQTTQIVTLTDGAARSLLKVPQNGIHLLNGTNFHIGNIVSNKLSQFVNVSTGSSLIAANGSETWTIQVAFDPATNGSVSDTLQIQTDDPLNPTINVSLSGTGTPVPNLAVADSITPTNDRMLNFGDIAVDGVGGAFGTATVTLTNNGSGPLTISQNGITLPAGPFSITGITSNTQGSIDLSTAPKTIAAGNTETWTISLQFDPTATGLIQQPLTILSDDPDAPTAAVSLLGTGKTPQHIVVTDSVLPSDDLAVDFGNVHADGPGKQLATQTITLSNTGQLPLQVNQNGINLATGTQFVIAGITSSTQGAINLSTGAKTIAPNSAENWTVTVQFDPAVAGSLSDSIQIASNDPSNPTITVALSGVGLNQPALRVTESDVPNNDLTQTFPATLNDGTGGRVSTQTLQLSNIGAQPLAVAQNGIQVLGGTNFHLVSIVSSTSGTVDLTSGSATIAAAGSETWTVTLPFDPTSTGPLSDTLRIISDDPVNPTVNVALSGQGVVAEVNAVYPTQAIHVSADSAYRITWNGTYSPGTATYSVYYDTDRNPADGLVSIATGLLQSKSFYDWQVPTGLVGGTYTIYVTMQDGSITAGSYATGSLTVDAQGSDRLLSAPVADQAGYTLSYIYNGTTYNAPYTLAMGDNTLYATAAGATHEYHITHAATLVDSDTTGYDELGNVTLTSDANGQTTVYTYDQLSRVTHIAYPDGSGVDYAYDAASNLLTMHDATGWQIYLYDVRNRLTSVTYSPTNNPSDPAALTIGYEYDLASRLTALVYPSGKHVEYGYDNAGKLTSVTEKNAGQPDLVTTYAYSATTGLLTSVTRPNDTKSIYTYDSNGQLIDILHERTSTSDLILQYHYTVDAAGRRTQVVVTTPERVRAEAYHYDDLNRLDQATYSDDNGTIDLTDKVVQYSYDGNGNRLTQTTYANGIATGATEILTYAYGLENRLTSVTDQTGALTRYFYDCRGNQVMKVTPTTTTLYTYDSRNLLIAVDDGTNHIEYQYDGAGRRISQNINGTVTKFVVDPSNPIYQTIEEVDTTGLVSASYTYGLSRIDGVLPGQSGATYYLGDTLGSVGCLTGATGELEGTYTYDAFGQVLSSPAGTTNPFLFTGERVDFATGLTYLRARYFDAQTGRFLSKDRLGFVDGANLYIYGRGNPVSFVDQTGDESDSSLGGQLSDTAEWVLDKLQDVLEETGLYSLPFNLKGVGELTKLAAQSVGNPGSVSWDQLAQAAETTLGEWGTLVAVGSQRLGEFSVAAESFLRNLLNPPPTVVPMPNVGSSNTNVDLSGIDPSSITPDIEFSLQKYGINVPPGGGGGGGASGPTWNLSADGVLTQNPGGVLIDEAATLVGANINDITGSTFDPVTHQLVFLGNSNPGTLHDVDLDLFTTAIASVYGSAVPPYVTLDPPAKLMQPSFNIGGGDGVIANGQTAHLLIHYTPYAETNLDDMSLTFGVNGSPATVRIDGVIVPNIIFGGGRHMMLLQDLSNSGLPSGVTVHLPSHYTPGGGVTLSGVTFQGTPQGQDSYWDLPITNNSGSTITISSLQLIPDLQHRKLGGRTDNTQLGWIMEEADRVMKELGGGKDQLTSAIYDSSNPNLPAGFMNILERYVANNQSGSFSNRFWFTPNEETLKRYINPVTGEATVIFDQSSVKLNTEALILGQPEDVTAKAFADWFNANYDAMAQIEFPVHDPNDPTGTNIIQVKIFEELRDAMKAVAVARFFHDNNIPLDTWWINSWTPPTAYVPATISTLTNSLTNGSVTVNFYGGVSIKQPNTYLPDAVAQAISNAVNSQRTPGTGDLPTQSWTVDTGTPVGSLNAVAASLAPQKQDANVVLSATDLSFASPGGRQLTFDRYYNSGYLGNENLGLGWQATRYDLQFQYPTFVDDYGLMRDGSGNKLSVSGLNSDTLLRSGEVRLVDQATGKLLNFFSSLSTAYSLDNQGNPIMAVSGLTADNVPTFTPGQYQDGSTLAQEKTSKNYTLTRLDGSTVVFDSQGNLLSTTNSAGYTITYVYTNGKLSQITDTGGQKLAITYGSDGRIQYVAGPDGTGTPQRRIAYTYDPSGLLTRVDTQALQGGSTYATVRSTQYQYNTDNQVSEVIGPDGITTLTNAADIRGRSTERQDALGNTADYTFAQDAGTGQRTSQIVDAGTTGVNDPTAQGIDALKYFAAGSTSTRQFDSTARATQTVDPLGNTTAYGYTGSSLLPNSVTLPTQGRPAISIERNAANLPTVINDPANIGGTPVQIVYTSANLPYTVTDAKGLVTMYAYTSWNAVQSVTVAYGTSLAATTTYFYNSRKQLDHIVDPLGHTIVTYTYDSLDRVQTVKDGDNVTTTYSYDTLGRLKRVYDPRLTGAVNYVEYTYNDNDQVTQIATPTGNILSQYDPTIHRLVSQTDLTGSTTQYGYDATSGLLTSVTQVSTGGNAVTQEVYDRRGQLALLISPEGNRTAFRYDVLGQPTDVIEDNNTISTASVSYQVTSPTTMSVNVSASESILVASLKYWQDGQPSSTGVTQSNRLADLNQFEFLLTDVDNTHHYRYELTLTDRVGLSQTLPEDILSGIITDHEIFYNNSKFDALTDNNAIATDKQVLLPNQTATFSNYTSYSRGINGIIVDIKGLSNPGTITATDFEFNVGNGDDWTAAPAPHNVDVQSDKGANGSDRITITWDNNAIENQWLQVRVLSTDRTGLSAADVFYFGNLVGDVNGDGGVTSEDVSAVRSAIQPFVPTKITTDMDINRDGWVDASDVLLARRNIGHVLTMIEPMQLEKLIVAQQTFENNAASDGGNPTANTANDAAIALSTPVSNTNTLNLNNNNYRTTGGVLLTEQNVEHTTTILEPPAKETSTPSLPITQESDSGHNNSPSINEVSLAVQNTGLAITILETPAEEALTPSLPIVLENAPNHTISKISTAFTFIPESIVPGIHTIVIPSTLSLSTMSGMVEIPKVLNKAHDVVMDTLERSGNREKNTHYWIPQTMLFDSMFFNSTQGLSRHEIFPSGRLQTAPADMEDLDWIDIIPSRRKHWKPNDQQQAVEKVFALWQ